MGMNKYEMKKIPAKRRTRVSEEEIDDYAGGMRHIDGGCILRRIVWGKMSSVREVLTKYRNYVQSHYGSCSVIFDGYVSGPSTKDHEHFRSMKSTTLSGEILSGEIIRRAKLYVGRYFRHLANEKFVTFARQSFTR